MDPTTIGIACIILARVTGGDPDTPVACLPPMAYGKVVEMRLPWTVSFFAKGTIEFEQLLEQQQQR